jgi:hypothetical protein
VTVQWDALLRCNSWLKLHYSLLHIVDLRAVSWGGGAVAACVACLLHQDIDAAQQIVQIVARGRRDALRLRHALVWKQQPVGLGRRRCCEELTSATSCS